MTEIVMLLKSSVSKLSKISNPTLIARPYLIYLTRIKPSNSVNVGQAQFIVLNDSANLKMVIKMYLHFFRFFLKVLELFKCCRGDRYTAADRNFRYDLFWFQCLVRIIFESPIFNAVAGTSLKFIFACMLVHNFLIIWCFPFHHL